jgi:hypothetical protein
MSRSAVAHQRLSKGDPLIRRSCRHGRSGGRTRTNNLLTNLLGSLTALLMFVAAAVLVITSV